MRFFCLVRLRIVYNASSINGKGNVPTHPDFFILGTFACVGGGQIKFLSSLSAGATHHVLLALCTRRLTGAISRYGRWMLTLPGENTPRALRPGMQSM
jgi:hypothetical protein